MTWLISSNQQASSSSRETPSLRLSLLPCASPSSRAMQKLLPYPTTTSRDTHHESLSFNREVSSQFLSSNQVKICVQAFLRSLERERSESDPGQVTGERYFSMFLINRMLSLELGNEAVRIAMDSGTLDPDRQDQAFGLVGCPGLLYLQLHSKRRCLTSSKTLESGNVTPVSVVLFMELRNLPGTTPKYSSRNPGQIGPSTRA